MEMVVGNFPRRMRMHDDIFHWRCIVGRQELGLEFQRRHDALGLLSIQIDALLPRGLGGIHHGGKPHVGVLRIANAFLQEAVNQGCRLSLVSPDGH